MGSKMEEEEKMILNESHSYLVDSENVTPAKNLNVSESVLKKLTPARLGDNETVSPAKLVFGSESILKNLTPGRLSHPPTETDNNFTIFTPNKLVLKNRFIPPSPTKTLKRLIIDKIILNNFKSYAGSQVIGPFHKNFTAVIGPNGSGKSNLIESLVFIFGRKASSMRLKQLSQLIHNSSGENSIQSASVDVYFKEIIDTDDIDGYDDVPNTAFVVKRVVHRNNTSTYKINESTTTQKDVVDLLKSKGIDLDNNRFMILQHEVEQISLMKPKSGNPDDPGLLEYLEDIIGSNKYVEKIESLEFEVGKLKDQEFEKGERVHISQAELRTLNEAKNAAITYVQNEKQLFQMRNATLQLDRDAINQEIMGLEERIKELHVKKREEEEKRKEKINENKEVAQEIRKISKAKEKNTLEIANCEKKVIECQDEDRKYQQDLKHLVNKETKCNTAIKAFDQEENEIMQEKTLLERKIPEDRQKLKTKEDIKDKLQKEVDEINYNLRSQTESLRRKKATIQKDMQPFKARQSGMKTKLNETNNELNILCSSNSSIFGNHEELQLNATQIRNNLTGKENTLSQIKTALNNIDSQLDPLNRMLEEIAMQENMIKKEIFIINSTLEEAKNSSREKQAGNRVVNEVLKAAKNRQLQGVIGRLGNLGSIEEKFDVAISTAGGGMLDMIIVQTFENAQQVVQFVKANNIGVVTCLSLDRIEKWVKDAVHKPFSAPQNSKRLFDLIACHNESYLPCFYQVFRDTLVCENLEIATKIAFSGPRYKVVTVDGKIVDKSGLMSGGGRPKRGGMSSKGADLSERDIDDLQSKLGEYQKKLWTIQNEKNQVQIDQETLKNDKSTIKNEEEKRLLDYQNDLKNLRELEDKIAKIQAQAEIRKENQKKISSLQNMIAQYDTEIKDIDQKIMDFENQSKLLDDEINMLGTPEQRSKRSELQKLIGEIEVMETEITKSQARFDQSDSNLLRIKKHKEIKEKELQDCTEKLNHIKNVLMKELEDKTLEILGNLKGLKEQQIKIDQCYEDMNQKIKFLEAMLDKFRKAIKEYETEEEEIKKKTKKLDEDSIRFTKELEKMRSDYNTMLESYDFINEIEEIASANVEGIVNPLEAIARNENESSEQITGQDQSMSVMSENPIRKKKFKFEISMISDVPVMTDMPKERLKELSKFLDEIKMKQTFQSESLEKTNPNLQSILEFKKRFQEHKEKLAEFQQITDQFNNKKKELDGLKKKRHDEFLSGFQFISQKLKETYQCITYGGDADLELIDSFDPFSEGILFSVRPPKKSWKQMSKLSGGEKTLSSLALVFALHYYKPTPLYFMDEIDAALDFRNVAIVAKYIKERTKNAQFIIISLRNNMFDLANKLVGVYKTYDKTKTISIVPNSVNKKIEENKKKEEVRNQN